ncbi:MAG: sulfurtransferase-like selenium metabolism protein YedF [Thermodesulfobacteriota bacterium]
MHGCYTVDARGLACPQPVLETKRALEEELGSLFRVLVDNPTSRENVSRFARNQGCRVEVQERGSNEFEIVIERGQGSVGLSEQEELLPCARSETAETPRNVVYITDHRIGRGDDELGQKLMRGFLRTWIDSEPLPWRMIFLNSGVYLTTVDDEATEALAMLHERGVDILSCGTCLQHFGFQDKLQVGRVTSMYEVIESMNAATKIISPD